MTTTINTTDVRVNYNNKTIVITKKFSKKIENPISKEFEEFMNLRERLADFEVIVKTSSKRTKKDSLKGLNYEFMKQYIARHDDENETVMKEFKKRAVKDEDNIATLSYGEVKKWFLEQYPEICAAA